MTRPDRCIYDFEKLLGCTGHIHITKEGVTYDTQRAVGYLVIRFKILKEIKDDKL